MGDAQLSLLDAPATRGASRKSDPQTAADAARSMEGQTLRDQQALVLGAVCELHRRYCRGANAWEVQCYLADREPPIHIQQNVIGTRFGEPRDLGHVLHRDGDDRPGPSHRKQHVFTPSIKGKAWIADRGEA